MRVAFHTLGCKVNQYETEAIKEAFVSRGAEIVGEEDVADVYVVNTCTVTNIADRKSRQYIRRMKGLNPDAFVVVTGCYAQVEPEEVAALPEVNLVIGNGRKADICGEVLKRLEQLEAAKAEGANASARDNADASGNASGSSASADVIVLRREDLTHFEDMGLVASSESGMTRAYIKIQEGCDRFCAYCLIPFARGPVRSRAPEEILAEARMLLDSGYKELVLTGINTALYGTEGGATVSLASLLEQLNSIDRDFRIRLSSLEPTVVDKNDVERIIKFDKLCHHLHLSVQSGSTHVLKLMNRHYTKEDYLDIVRALRAFDPLYGITTDIIVGFSGETETDFADSLDVVDQSQFARVHAFRYSPRRGTAGEKLPSAVSGTVKAQRANALAAAADRAAAAFNEKNFGTVHRVLTEERVGKYVTGYTGNYIRTYILDKDKLVNLGEFYNVELTELYKDGCIAQIRED